MYILCTTPIEHLPGVKEALSKCGTLRLYPHATRWDLLSNLGKVDVLFVNPNRQTYKIDKQILENLGAKIVVSASTGSDHIDLDYCKKAEIKVLTLRGDPIIYALPATAELALGLSLSLLRHIPKSFDSVKKGGWDYTQFVGTEMKDLAVGIVGMGRLGGMFRRYCLSMGADVDFFDPIQRGGLNSLAELMERSSLVSIHAHLDGSTRNMIGREEIRLMTEKHWPAYIVNTSRGGIVDEDAVIQSLYCGELSGYATDVLRDECGNLKNSSLLNLAMSVEHLNIIITPHTGGMTLQGQTKAFLRAAQLLEEVCEQKS
ncbi:MAG: NAD(P)-dependent oxidoreductase [Candidatus Thorarchaeota archaeon]|jgi:D-3-phosphoglycerate dehydrogenase